jgi:hypothetical protein
MFMKQKKDKIMKFSLLLIEQCMLFIRCYIMKRTNTKSTDKGIKSPRPYYYV